MSKSKKLKNKKILQNNFNSAINFTYFISDLLRQHSPDYIHLFPDDIEKNKVILYKQTTLEGELLWTTCLVRIGNINQGNKVPSDNKTSNIIEAIRHLLKKEFIISVNNRIKTDRVILVTNGYIAEKAKNEIQTGFKDAVIIFWDIEKVLELTSSKWATFFESKEPVLYEYCNNLKKKLEDISKELAILYYNKQVKKLWDIFINLQLIETKINTKVLSIPTEKIKASNKKSNEYIKDDNIVPFKDIIKEKFKVDEIIEAGKDIIIIGDFGSGKSTILKRICYSIMNNVKSNTDINKIPILINCRDMCNFDFDLKKHIKYEFTSLTGGKEINFNKLLESNKVILLLDGLEEKFEEYGDRILDTIQKFKKIYPSIQLIIATRPFLILDIEPLFDDFRRFEILPLDYNQISELLEKWYPTNFKQTSKLINVLKKTSLVVSIPKTPLAITLLAIIFEDEEKVEEIPANITELYNKFTEVFTGRWDKDKGISMQDKYGIRSHMIRQLAFYMQYRNMIEITKQNLSFFIETYRLSKGYEDITTADLINELLTRNPLIIEWNGNYRFIHLSFQEYYASFGIFQSNDNVNNPEKFLIKNFLTPQWSNVVLFYVGNKKDCPDFIVALAKYTVATELDQRFLKLDNLGKIMQAAISTDINAKVESLYKSLQILDMLRNDLLNLVKTDETLNLTFKRQGISELSLIMLLKDIFQTSYKSRYLRAAMNEVYSRKVTNGISNLSKYVLSYTLTDLLKDPNYLLEFISEENVALEWKFLGRYDLQKYEKSFDQKQIKIIKSVERKIKKGRRYLISAFRKLRGLPKLTSKLIEIQ